MKAIVAVDMNWGIGFKGALLERIPEDMKRFKQLTMGKVVVMGRQTFESLPNKEPLTGRINIVLSTKANYINYINEGITVCPSLSRLLQELKKYPADDVFVIGGEAVYKQLLPYCTEAHVTRIERTYEADRFFPDLDNDKTWRLVSAGESRIYNGIRYSFLRYANGAVRNNIK
ncbi:MAG: dihydrofolate reductase [Peptococcaceae bacterium]|nr:dihydrofolate reductase [Peptococcaceae bacterium]MDH7526118.1 dihydrofolate reductase [Peptococcaceae bacterium]